MWHLTSTQLGSSKHYEVIGGITPWKWPHFALNIDYGGIHWPCPHNLVGSWDRNLAVKPYIVGVASANMQWDRFVCTSCNQKRENTAFQLVLWSDWRLSNPSKKVARSSTPCWKRRSFGYRKWTVAKNTCICSRVASVGNLKNLEKQAQSSKG